MGTEILLDSHSRVRELRRRAVAACVLLTIGVHLFFLLNGGRLYGWLGFFYGRAPEPAEEAAKPLAKPREQTDPDRMLPFVLTEPPEKEETPAPEEVEAIGVASTLARQPMPDPELARGGPTAAGKREIVSSLPPAPAAPKREAARQLPRQEERPAEQMRPEDRKPSELGELPKLPEAKPAQAQTQAEQAQRQPVFRDLRASPPSSPRPETKRLSTAMRVGEKTMAAVRAKYPEFYAQVLKAWVESINRQRCLMPATYNQADVMVRVALSADSKIEKLEVVAPLEGGLAERNFTVATIRDIAFPPLTDEMKADPDFKRLVFLLFF